MSDKSNEQISNLMDGELETNASQFLLKRMAADQSLSKTWESYHLVKSCLQKEKDEPLVIDVSSRVSDYLNQQLSLPKQAPINVAKKVSNNRWLRPVLGMGIAASVAFMSVFLLQNQKVESQLQPAISTIANIDGIQVKANVFKPNISANMATSSQSLVPLSLSRFPSVSQKSKYEQDYSKNFNTPYLIYHNNSTHQKHLSPLKIKDVSD